MDNKPYYLVYENLYKKAYEANVERCGNLPDDDVLFSILLKWVNDNQLHGKRIIDFACGEGAAGEILSKIGCIYHGVDISDTAIKKAKTVLKKYPHATVAVHDMVTEPINEIYDAAIDAMGLYMLILDSDRMNYLQNAFRCLNLNAPMLFFQERYSTNAPDDKIDSMEQWLAITGDDYITYHERIVNGDITINIPNPPSRPKTKEGYIREMNEAGFVIENFMNTEDTASIFVRKIHSTV